MRGQPVGREDTRPAERPPRAGLLGVVPAAELRCLRLTFVPGFLEDRGTSGSETKFCQPDAFQSKSTQTRSSSLGSRNTVEGLCFLGAREPSLHRDFTWTVHRPFIGCCCTCPVSEVHGTRRRAAARDALATRTRALTAAILAVSAALSGVFAGIAAASAPGHKLSPGTSSPGAKTSTSRQTAAHSGLTIPPLPAAPGPGNLGSASAPAPTPAPAHTPTQSPPPVVSGSS